MNPSLSKMAQYFDLICISIFSLEETVTISIAHMEPSLLHTFPSPKSLGPSGARNARLWSLCSTFLLFLPVCPVLFSWVIAVLRLAWWPRRKCNKTAWSSFKVDYKKTVWEDGLSRGTCDIYLAFDSQETRFASTVGSDLPSPSIPDVALWCIPESGTGRGLLAFRCKSGPSGGSWWALGSDLEKGLHKLEGVTQMSVGMVREFAMVYENKNKNQKVCITWNEYGKER